MIWLLIIPFLLLGYFFCGVVHYYFWRNYFHEHNVCKKRTYGGCNDDCGMWAFFASIPWPVFPLLFVPIKYLIILPKATHRLGKRVGLKIAKADV